MSGFAHAQDQPEAARHYTTAVLWQQHSGEYRALCFQAYNFARVSLKAAMKKRDRRKPNCIIVDVDETVLDNSAFQGHEIKKGTSFIQKDWTEWAALAQADTVPGAHAFLKFAASKKIEVFYITNRERAEHAGTLENLRRYGFPNADEAHLVVKEQTSDKEPRRKAVAERYNILMLCGDNLSDFSNVFYRENRETKTETERAQSQFGSRFIVLPNPMYGDWEKLLYPPGQLTEEQRGNSRLEKLKSY
ncbi:5'-nucleotidase, lipoprotein e(P4) family [Pedobacter yulinensis]|uniref:5'-nucleotidase, lipoprotein e(P4) family n=2 Tax=Pedobacter yulinensis TaxID=2126353 RepID=A0A2T3HNV3_9SPHI|nr:5'-nucleotidase, lipoprotein e(P4) family [Pedobacter yulinensis]